MGISGYKEHIDQIEDLVRISHKMPEKCFGGGKEVM